jgi:Na+-translocating ferredoxin:NAD+ oxidoreductase RNF subunit RnfB
MGIIIAAAVVGITGILIGVFLGIAGIKFKVKANEQEEAIIAALPGNNCGGCGYPGCSGLAAAIAEGKAAANACPVGGAETGEKIAAIMGTEAETKERQTAFVHCQGTCEHTKTKYQYEGAMDCRIMAFVPGGGPKACASGCLGYGTCVQLCPFDAITIQDGVAVIDPDNCKACGKCVEGCPKHLITLKPYNSQVAVSCVSADKGPVTMKACDLGCIGCGLCVKVCPTSAIKVDNFHATIDYEKCTSCGKCQEKCPKHSIVKTA